MSQRNSGIAVALMHAKTAQNAKPERDHDRISLLSA